MLKALCFFEIHDQGFINSLKILLIRKSETKMGGMYETEKFFFRY